jgi:surface carbohydrate biosynthesis protein
MKNKPTILISVDHKWRDLAGYVYAKLLLEELGYKVILVRNGFEEYYADIYNPQAVVMVHIYDKRKQDVIKRLKERNILIFLMPTEGIPTLEGTRKVAAGCFSDLSNIDLHFVWNEEMKKIMVEEKIIDPKKIYVTGVPRFDFYREPLNKILMSKQQLKNKYNVVNNYPIITWTTNFTHASFYNKNQDFLKKDWSNLQMDKIFNPEEVARKDFESRKVAFDAIERMLTEISEINLLIKLHPSEDHTYYYQKIKNLPTDSRRRVRIINKEYIWDVLNVTDILLKRSCTTGIEAWLLDKPTIELRLNPKEWYYSKEHAQGSDEVTTYRQLIEAVTYYLQGGLISSDKKDKRQEFIRKWCSVVDGKATERFVRELDKKIKPKDNCEIKSKKKDLDFIKSFLITNLMELTNFKIHDLKVYGINKNKDKLGRFDKFFNRNDEREWLSKLNIR